ncbi:MAG TPA: hypothetical protein VFK50_06115 [Sphingomicrobium sp.]|nr:hypothetical protein [Sphingomicrobium sp.]
MSESGQKRKSWISVGEAIGLAALVISGLGLWIAWQDSSEDSPTRIVEQRQAIPLTLRGVPEDGGRTLEILPVEPGHGLQSLTLAVKGRPPIEVGSDGRLAASDLERALGNVDKKDGTITARIDARYVEAGADRRAGRDYRIRYRWEGGGLFGGRSLRIAGLSR